MANVEEITSKNTKAEIFEALQEALKREKELAKIKSNPIKEEKQVHIQEVVEKTKVNVEKNIFSVELNNKFKELEEAISFEEERLKNLYSIEKEMQDITVAVNAGKDCIIKIENEKQEKLLELENKIKELENTFKQKSTDLQKEYDEKSKNLKVERERENEEYTYKLKRERERENNLWEDEKYKREIELSKKEHDVEELYSDASSKVEYLKELEEKVAKIPELLKEEYEKGKAEATEKLNVEYNHEKILAQKDYESALNRQNDKIESLTTEISKVIKQNNMLQEKLDNAYMEIKELATKTVESASGVRIIGNNNAD